MFQRIIGILGALAVIGAIVMVSISPRKEGFFPGFLTCEKRIPPTEKIEEERRITDTVSYRTDANAVPAEILTEPVADSMPVE